MIPESELNSRTALLSNVISVASPAEPTRKRAYQNLLQIGVGSPKLLKQISGEKDDPNQTITLKREIPESREMAGEIAPTN